MTEAKYNFYFGRERDRSYKPSPIGDTLIQGCDAETIRALGESVFSRFIDEYGSDEFNLISFGTDRPKVNYADISQNPKTYLVDSYEKMAYYVEAEAKIASMSTKPTILSIAVFGEGDYGSTTKLIDVLTEITKGCYGPALYVVLITDSVFKEGYPAFDYIITTYCGNEDGLNFYTETLEIPYDKKRTPRNSGQFLLTEVAYADVRDMDAPLVISTELKYSAFIKK